MVGLRENWLQLVNTNFHVGASSIKCALPLPAVLEGDENPDIYKALLGPTVGHYREHKPRYICFGLSPAPGGDTNDWCIT